jgi:hypothetical protein
LPITGNLQEQKENREPKNSWNNDSRPFSRKSIHLALSPFPQIDIRISENNPRAVIAP